MVRPRGVAVTGVDSASLAAKRGIVAGSRLLRINGLPVRDELDLVFYSSGARLRIEFLEPNGELRQITLVKAHDKNLGIEIEPLRPRRCRNRCIFCFIDQNPSGLRPTLYVKDEDLRLSFTHGHYITTTSLRPADLKRIVAQRLSPLYISVHATNPDLRRRMIGLAPGEGPDLLDTLRFLAKHRIQFHTQIVLCPGWNDGAELERSLDDLEEFRPALLSVAVVPVGLTAHREGLEDLKPMTPAWAKAVIDQVTPRQQRFLEEEGERVVLLADEFYLMANARIPDYSDEEIEAQIENGVGMVNLFWRDAKKIEKMVARRKLSDASKSGAKPLRAALLTGLLGVRVLEPLVDQLNAVKNLRVEIIALENSLYGPGVTVSGLLPGCDFDRGIQNAGPIDIALIPDNALRAEGDRFLDDVTLEELRPRHPKIEIRVVSGGAAEIASTLISLKSH